MPRPVRVHVPGALYYVTSKAMEGFSLFQSEADYRAYLELLQGYQAQFGFKLFAYVLLPEELHLCLELPEGTTISTIMHALNSRYTKYVTRRDGRAGHVFQQRFHLTLVEKGPHLLGTVAGLHRLPQRLSLSPQAVGYLWSNIAEYCAAPEARRPEVDEVLTRLQIAVPGIDYCAYVEALPVNALEAFDAQRQQHVVGSAAFVEMVRARQQRATPAAAEVGVPAAAPVLAPAAPVMEVAVPLAVRRRWQPAVATALVAVMAVSTTTGLLAAKSKGTKRTRPTPTRYVQAPATPAAETAASLANYAPPMALANTAWTLQIKPMYVNGAAAVQQDELRFDLKRVSSAQLQGQGFVPSNYSLTTDANGVILWETMQTGPHDEVICWRGEWDGEVMRGVMTRQAPGQIASNYAFVGTPQPGTATRSET